jgi:response regulator of citrate/malate metabolism
MKILLVEDRPEDLEASRDLISIAEPKANISTACSLEEMKSVTTKQKFDLVFLDLGLPDVKGFKTVEETQCILTDTPNAHTPIIILTALEDYFIAKKAIRMGCREFLVKGEFDVQDLSRSINFATYDRHAASKGNGLKALF